MYPESTTSEGRVYPAEATRRDRACRQVPPLLPRKRGAPLARRPVRPPAAASGCGWRLRNKFGKWVCFFLLIWQWAGFTEALAAEPAVAQAPMASAGDATNAASPLQTNAGPRFEVRAYEVTGDTLLSPDTLNSLFARHTGPNISLTGLVEAASDLQLEYRNRGYPPIGVAIAQQEII